jgi:Uma2 family endonuclease
MMIPEGNIYKTIRLFGGGKASLSRRSRIQRHKRNKLIYMAAETALPFVSVEEYLNTCYLDGDREYVDGVIVERNVGTLPHSLLQKILLKHFAGHENIGFVVLPECRTRVAASRFRVPDVVLIPQPFNRKAKFYDAVPIAVIEILSPEDRLNAVLARFQDYDALGVRFIVQMDPERRVTHVYEHGSLIQRELTSLEHGEKSIPFDTRALFAELEA